MFSIVYTFWGIRSKVSGDDCSHDESSFVMVAVIPLIQLVIVANRANAHLPLNYWKLWRVSRESQLL